MNNIKFKMYDSKANEIVDYVNCSVTSMGDVQSFNNKGVIGGVLENRHLTPLLYAGKKDIKGKEIYDGFIIKRTSSGPGNNDFLGVVVFDECGWWIEDRKKKEAIPLFSETEEDHVVGNIFQDKKLAKQLGF